MTPPPLHLSTFQMVAMAVVIIAGISCSRGEAEKKAKAEQSSRQASELAAKTAAESEEAVLAKAKAEAVLAKAKAEAVLAKAKAEAVLAKAEATAKTEAIAKVSADMAAETNNLVELRSLGFMELVTIDFNGVAFRNIEGTQSKRVAWTNLSDPEILAVLQTKTAYKLVTSAGLLTPKAKLGSVIAERVDALWEGGESLTAKIKWRLAFVNILRDYNMGVIGTMSLPGRAQQIASGAIYTSDAANSAAGASQAVADSKQIRYTVRVNTFTGDEVSTRRYNKSDVRQANAAQMNANAAQEQADSVFRAGQAMAAKAAADAAAAEVRLAAARVNLQRNGFEVSESGVKLGSQTVALIPSFEATAAVDRMIAELRQDPIKEAGRQTAILGRTKYLESVAGRAAMKAKLETDKAVEDKLAGERKAHAFFAGARAAMQRTGFVEETISTLLSKGGRIVGWGSYETEPISFKAAPENAITVTAGAKHTMALRPGGSVFSLDYAGFGPLPVPSGLVGVVAISAGADHTLALRQDGTVLEWNSRGQTQNKASTDLTRVVAVAAGGGFSLALRLDGTVVAWGYNSVGQTKVPFGLNEVVAIDAGATHAVALQKNGTLVVWGGNLEQNSPPVTLGAVMSIAAGAHHTIALREDGTVVAWGSNSEGQLDVPKDLNEVVAIAAGSRHNIALRRDGTIVCWGENKKGQTSVPAGLTKVAAIAAGESHTVAIRLD